LSEPYRAAFGHLDFLKEVRDPVTRRSDRQDREEPEDECFQPGQSRQRNQRRGPCGPSAAQEAAAAGLSAELGIAFQADDIFLTRGAHGALGAALNAVVDAGDEVIFVSPPWFFYEAMLLGVGATPIKTRLMPPAYDLDVDAIAAAITPRTRMVLLNIPHNRTGRIFPMESLKALAATLHAASERNDRPISIFSLVAVLLRSMSGAWIDRQGVRRVLLPGAAFMVLASLGFLAAGGPSALIALMGGFGVGYGLVTMAAAVLAASAPAEQRGRALSIYYLSAPVSMAVAAPLGLWLPRSGPSRRSARPFCPVR
jgi:hypothetical protein